MDANGQMTAMEVIAQVAVLAGRTDDGLDSPIMLDAGGRYFTPAGVELVLDGDYAGTIVITGDHT